MANFVNGNYVFINRSIRSNPFLRKSPWWVQIMWLDLLLNARFDEYEIKWDGTPLVLQRGQFVAKQDALAKCYKVAQPTVGRWLKKMELEGMIKREFLVKVDGVWALKNSASQNASSNALGGTLITICNYNKFQAPLITERIPNSITI